MVHSTYSSKRQPVKNESGLAGIKVATTSPVSAAAGAIAHAIRSQGETRVLARGGKAVLRAIFAVARAKSFLKAEGTDIQVSLEFDDLSRPGLVLRVSARTIR